MISFHFKLEQQLGHKFALVVFIYCLSSSVYSVGQTHSVHSTHQKSHELDTEFELPLLYTPSNINITEPPSDSKKEDMTSFNQSTFNQSTKLRLSDYKGKVVYIDFWASWCTPCLVSMPLLNNLRNKYKAAGFEIIAINLDETPILATKFMNAMNIDYPVVSDVDGKIAKQYQVTGLPSAYIIDANGQFKLMHRGFKRSDINFIEANITKLLDEIE